MQSRVKQREKTNNEMTGSPFSKNSTCPKCGEKMVVGTRQVVSNFPAPALERLVCSGSSCNYSQYVKLDSRTTPDGSNQGRER